MKKLILDKAFTLSSRTITDEGFLTAPAYVARAGVQDYLAYELGLDGDPMRVVGIYRPESEVFDAASLATYSNKEITDDHPTEFVSADNYKELSRGQVTSEGVRDGDMVKVDIIVKDKAAIDALESGKTALSAGYYSEHTEHKGTHDGKPYEYVQSNIRINHVALVDVARAGNQAKVFDKKPPTKEGALMAHVTIDGAQVEVQDSATATLIASKITALQEVADSVGSLQAKIDGLTEDNQALALKCSDSSIAEAAEQRQAVIDTARKAIKDFDGTGKTLDAMKLEVCKAVFPSRDAERFSDAGYLSATFDMAEEKMEDEEEEEADKEKKAEDSLKHAFTPVQVADSATNQNAARFAQGAK